MPEARERRPNHLRGANADQEGDHRGRHRQRRRTTTLPKKLSRTLRFAREGSGRPRPSRLGACEALPRCGRERSKRRKESDGEDHKVRRRSVEGTHRMVAGRNETVAKWGVRSGRWNAADSCDFEHDLVCDFGCDFERDVGSAVVRRACAGRRPKRSVVTTSLRPRPGSQRTMMRGHMSFVVGVGECECESRPIRASVDVLNCFDVAIFRDFQMSIGFAALQMPPRNEVNTTRVEKCSCDKFDAPVPCHLHDSVACREEAR